MLESSAQALRSAQAFREMLTLWMRIDLLLVKWLSQETVDI